MMRSSVLATRGEQIDSVEHNVTNLCKIVLRGEVAIVERAICVTTCGALFVLLHDDLRAVERSPVREMVWSSLFVLVQGGLG